MKRLDEALLEIGVDDAGRLTMTAGLGPTLELTGNVADDMDTIRAFYADKAGVHPARRVEPRLREEGRA